jgi:hypothetical protein
MGLGKRRNSARLHLTEQTSMYALPSYFALTITTSQARALRKIHFGIPSML